ncbi:OprD family porin [Gillisia sp. M10.2A]|uniref:OprD family porin n=1 Tax=Gillisia lutea TaxID=2909668 RepID=A0ABS9EE37_9FLAO|nr:OprD family outer membrane porin [Gillisia lutea]MCF4101111.1 OprD family porin [Gillisia lutea]
MSLKQLLYSFLFICSSQVSYSQNDTDTLKKHDLSGAWRTYFMNTANNGNLKDFTALATGGNIKYEFALNKNLSFGIAGYTSINLGIQDLEIADAATNKLSRYEEGLFDRTNLDHKFLFLLGELYVNYKFRKQEINLGRMKLNSPFVNGQDGRMIPTLVQGVWYKNAENKDIKLQAGIINEIAPRSTGEFYKLGESIGTYAVGRNPDESNSGYAGNTHSNYMAIANTNVSFSKSIKAEMWNYFTHNISNTFYIKPAYNITRSSKLELEWLHQNRVGDGGNKIDSLRYFSNSTADILGIKLQQEFPIATVSLSYNRIFSNGRFLFPREWGREFLFSFQKRERSEGSANNHALVMYIDKTVVLGKTSNLKSILSVGHHWKASVLNPEDNKYAFPDYKQINLDLFFNSTKLKNLKPELLLVSKFSNGDIPDNPNFIINKVDLFHVDFILNYYF